MKNIDFSKIVLSVSALIVAASMFYYFVIFLPDKQEKVDIKEAEKETVKQAQIDLKNQQECAEKVEKLYQKDAVDELEGSFTYKPESSFSNKYNTCLWYGGGRSGDYAESWVVDAYKLSEPPVATTQKYIYFWEDDNSEETCFDNLSDKFTCSEKGDTEKRNELRKQFFEAKNLLFNN